MPSTVYSVNSDESSRAGPWSPRRHTRTTPGVVPGHVPREFLPEVEQEYDLEDETPFFQSIDDWFQSRYYQELQPSFLVPRLEFGSEEGYDLTEEDYSYSGLAVIAEGTSVSLVWGGEDDRRLKTTSSRVAANVAQWRMRYSLNGEYTLFNTHAHMFLTADFYGTALSLGRPVLSATQEHGWILEANQYIVGDRGKRVLALENDKPVLKLTGKDKLTSFYESHSERLFVLVENPEFYFKSLTEMRVKNLLDEINQMKLSAEDRAKMNSVSYFEPIRSQIFLPEPGQAHRRRSQNIQFDLSEKQQKACRYLEKAMQTVNGVFLVTPSQSNLECLPMILQLSSETPCHRMLEVTLRFPFPYSSATRGDENVESEFALKMRKLIAVRTEHRLREVVIKAIAPGSTVVKCVIYNRTGNDLTLLKQAFPDADIEEHSRRLTPVLKLSKDDFDCSNDCLSGGASSGNTLNKGKVEYTEPSKKYMRVGLRIRNRYENSNWTQNDSGSWTSAFIGRYLREGKPERYEGKPSYEKIPDINQLNSKAGKSCGIGVAFTNSVDTCAIPYGEEGKRAAAAAFLVAIEARIDTTKTRIPKDRPEYRVVNKPEAVRPLAIVIPLDEAGGGGHDPGGKEPSKGCCCCVIQ